MNYFLLNASIVFILGLVVSLSELISRYNEGRYIFKVIYSYLYLLLNGVFATGAYLLVKYFKNENLDEISKLEINYIIIAGFGGMMLLRSSLFSIKHKDDQIDIGIGAIAQIFLDAIEKKMNANAAVIRMERINALMKNIDFDKAVNKLSTFCISYIDNFSKEDEDNLAKQIERVKNIADLDNLNKVLQLGRYISMYCNYNVLEKAIEVLGDQIKILAEAPKPLEIQDTLNYWIKRLKDGKDTEI